LTQYVGEAERELFWFANAGNPYTHTYNNNITQKPNKIEIGPCTLPGIARDCSRHTQ
jgi:hypothetical protein